MWLLLLSSILYLSFPDFLYDFFLSNSKVYINTAFSYAKTITIYSICLCNHTHLVVVARNSCSLVKIITCHSRQIREFSFVCPQAGHPPPPLHRPHSTGSSLPRTGQASLYRDLSVQTSVYRPHATGSPPPRTGQTSLYGDPSAQTPVYREPLKTRVHYMPLPHTWDVKRSSGCCK